MAQSSSQEAQLAELLCFWNRLYKVPFYSSVDRTAKFLHQIMTFMNQQLIASD